MLGGRGTNHHNQLHYYLSTMRHLKPVQVFARLRYLAKRHVLHRSSAYRSIYTRQTLNATKPTPVPFSTRGKTIGDPHDIGHSHFTFIGRKVYLGEPIDWFPPGETQLWLYNLHYFDYVLWLAERYRGDQNERTYQLFRRLVSQWIRACPVATPIAWDSYPVSQRITSWIKAFTVFEPAIRQDESFAAEFLASLYAQASFLEDNLEYHLLGNHLIENGRALLLAGLFFSGTKATGWRRRGELILWNEMREQFVDDGGHYERSPMYHQIMLGLYLDVDSTLKALGHTVPGDVPERLQRMQSWLKAVLHPDGDIPLLNDAVLDTAGNPEELLDGVPGAPDGLNVLPSTGYFIFRNNSSQDFLIFDCGPLGPDFQSGHGHCDTMTYELTVVGQRIIVDSGADDYYGDLSWRTYYRSTRAHNTVVVDGAEQSEIWSRFRVGRRARPIDVRWGRDNLRLAYVCGTHGGYRRLDGRVSHRRWVCWVDRRFWVICDQITGFGRHTVESLIHFHPEATVRGLPMTSGRGIGIVQRDRATLKILPWGAESLTTYFGETGEIQGWYTPRMGTRLKSSVWGLSRTQELPIWLGYVLWPSSTEVSCDYSVIDERSCRVKVASAESRYQVIFHHYGAQLERA